ncbi:MAG: hypothetical protein H6834_08345 [Planctomycetes bacterium]|nr:hypothetical protein [Planctomycetota bacterium]
MIALLMIAPSLCAQQECERWNDDGTIVTNQTTGGPNLLIGMRLVSPSNFTVSAAQVYTGLRTGASSFAVWSHDPGGDRPLMNLSGDGAYQQLTHESWQGAALPSPVTLTAGQIFWLVWGMPNSSRWPAAAATTTNVPYRGSFDGGLTWNGANGGASPWAGAPLKIRLFCPANSSPVIPVGSAKTGAFGDPINSLTGWGVVHNELGFFLDNAAAQAPAVLVLGVQLPAPIVIPGIADLYASPDLTLSFLTSGTPGRSPGSAAIELRVPPGSAGFQLATQWLILDAAAVGGVSHTNGLYLTIL